MLKKVAIFCGGPSSEHEVSINSVKTIYKFLDKTKFEIKVCFIAKDLTAKLLKDIKSIDDNIKTSSTLTTILKKLKDQNYFALLAGIHGEFAEDGKLQGLLELFAVPYSGTRVSGSALAMDKYRSSIIAQKIDGLKVPIGILHLTSKPFNNKGLHYPLVIKPNNLGSSIGVFKVKNDKEVKEAIGFAKDKLGLSEVFIQECIENAIELSCGCLQKKNGDFILLPPIEIHPKKSELFDYISKYEVGGSEEITPPVSISKKLADEISNLATTLHSYLGLQTYSRSDFLIKDNEIYYLETNTLPGMTSTSLLPQEAAAAGIDYSDLLKFIINNS